MKKRIKDVRFLFQLLKNPVYYVLIGLFFVLGILMNLFNALYGSKESIIAVMPGMFLYLCLINHGIFSDIILRYKGIRVFPGIRHLGSHTKTDSVNLLFLLYSMIIFGMLEIGHNPEYSWTLFLISYVLWYCAGLIIASLGGKTAVLQIIVGYGTFILALEQTGKRGFHFSLEISPVIMAAFIIVCIVSANLIAGILSRRSIKSDTIKSMNALY